MSLTCRCSIPETPSPARDKGLAVPKKIWQRLSVGMVALLFIGTRPAWAQDVRSDLTSPPSSEDSEASSLKIDGAPEEIAGEYQRPDVPSALDKQLAEETVPVLGLMGAGGDAEKNRAAVKAMGKILGEHPDYSDGFFLRATVLYQALHDKNYLAILADIDKALELRSSSRYKSAYDSEAPMYGMRARVEKERGNYQQALADLEKAINAKPGTPNDVFSVSGVKPDKGSPGDLWKKKDLDDIVNRFPSDYRGYLFRGCFYSFFTTFGEQYYAPAVADYQKAISSNPKSWLGYYLLGEIYTREALLTKKAITSDAHKARLQMAAAGVYDKAIKLNPKFAKALMARADTRLELKQFKLAIEDFDKVIELDPKYGGAYNDRGLANVSLSNYYDAIEDFSKTIENKKGDDSLHFTYKSRADAYMKVRDFERAIKDYGKGIQLLIGREVLLMSIVRFRALYPEYSAIADELLAKGLWRKFYPNLKYADFAKDFLHKAKGEGLEPTLCADLYVGRGDAYLNLGEFGKAAAEFNRVLNGLPTYVDAVDRWRPFWWNSGGKNLLDIKTIDASENNIVKFWTKTMSEGSSHGVVSNYAVNCSSKMLDQIQTTSYDVNGKVVGESGDAGWQRIIPETIGEVLYNGFCRGASK